MRALQVLQVLWELLAVPALQVLRALLALPARTTPCPIAQA
jgi:hypothetical protein